MKKHGASPHMCNQLLLTQQGTMNISCLTEKHSCENTFERLTRENSLFMLKSGSNVSK